MRFRAGANRPRPASRAFTLVELLVVILIIVLVSAVVLPTVLPALQQRQIGESARILQAALAGIRDAAIRHNAPRGLRLLPDPVLTQPPLTTAATSNAADPGAPVSNAGTVTLAYNRFIPIEPAGNYTEGKVMLAGNINGGSNQLHPMPPAGTLAGFPPPYPWYNPTGALTAAYPAPDAGGINRVLMVEESVFVGDAPAGGFNPPTSWCWNIRVGDRIRFSESGRYYTVVGPMTLTPANGNPEMFVNVGVPGTTSPLVRTYPDGSTSKPEFLFLVNGEDDDGDGIADNGFNGIDDNWQSFEVPNGLGVRIDELAEWTETEKWVGVPPSFASSERSYTILRRPVPTQGARETALPPSIVIDATTWDGTRERSRLPIDPNTLYVDIMMDPSGRVIPTTVYSTPASAGMGSAFDHFWLTERTDVHEKGELAVVKGQVNQLPMPQGTPNYTGTIFLKGRRSLVTVFTRNGLITTDAIENFDGNDINAPFQDARNGMREAK